VNPYENDPEYIRLVNARNAVRGGGGGIQTMDYKPEDRALDDYIRSKNPTYRADKESAMGTAANLAGKFNLQQSPGLQTGGTGSTGEAPEDFGYTEDQFNQFLKDVKITGNTDPEMMPTPAVQPQPQNQTLELPPTLARGGALESGGFVIPADVVSHLGNGSSEAGLRLLAQRFGAAPIKGKGDGMSDSIKTTIDGHQPARVANEEARLTKAQVQAAGGAKKLYAMMDKIRQARTGSKQQGKKIDPGKFMPGGSVQRFTTGGVPAGTIGTESSLSNWAGDYVTDMLGKGQALSELPYEQYKGPLTADASDLQSKVSTGLGGLSFPGNLGQSFSSSTAPTIGAGGQPTGGGGIAANYMNPYLSAVLNPQMEEMRRQAQINNLSGVGALTKSGAFGGGRQAIMESEANRNLLTEQNKTIGKGYSDAYDKAMGQFNTEQGQAKDLAGLMAQQGAVDRGIESEGIAANKAQFEEARANPYKMVQFQQSLLSGLPLEAQTFNQADVDSFTKFSQSFKTINDLLKALGQD
jgi:hypothetical protein